MEYIWKGTVGTSFSQIRRYEHEQSVSDLLLQNSSGYELMSKHSPSGFSVRKLLCVWLLVFMESRVGFPSKNLPY